MAVSVQDVGKSTDNIILEEKQDGLPVSVKTELDTLKRSNTTLKKLVLVFGVLVLCLGGAVVAILINEDLENDCKSSNADLETCGSLSKSEMLTRQNVIGEPTSPSLFHDLTAAEIKEVRRFLEEDDGIKLSNPESAMLNQSHCYMMDLEPPTKAEALTYLDDGGARPVRKARVVLFRGDLIPPVVEERVCGPLGNISSCDLDFTAPFFKRPIEYREYRLYDMKLIPDIHRTFGHIIRESYQGSVDYDNCEDDCLNYWVTPVTQGIYGNNVRKVWIWLTYAVEYISLLPLDFAVLCNVDGVDEEQFYVEKVWYADVLYSTPQDLVTAYASGNLRKTRTSYPVDDKNLFSTMHLRGQPKPRSPLRPPELVEPDGRRYMVKHRKVEYLDMWSFHLRMSPIYGPALYDVRFLGERIVYEMSLAEVAVFYTGNNPPQRTMLNVDSAYLTGGKAKTLVPGADCPLSATYLPVTLAAQDNTEPAVFNRVICIFEQNSGVPLRRHHSYSADEGAFYSGMLDSHLVVRSIHAVDNYDYILDFLFYQSGTVGVSAAASGYLATSFWSEAESSYGFRLQENVLGTLHHHIVNFKVDIDVKGTSNRYETMELKEQTTTVHQSDPPLETSHTVMEQQLKATEKEAAYKFNFDLPMEHIIHNNAYNNSLGLKRSFRIVNKGVSKQLVKENVGNGQSVSWARYQLAVTKYSENERRSSSVYNQWDAVSPSVNFQSFIDNNDNIVDEDLVAWVSMGVHHIPHTEDLPVTTTGGKALQFYLMPYNYFTECPSMASRDAVRIDHKDSDSPEEGLLFEYHGTGDVSKMGKEGVCVLEPWDMSTVWRKDPDSILETNENKGIL